MEIVLLVILWPIAIVVILYGNIHDHLKLDKIKVWLKIDKIKTWYVNRKEDKLFYEKSLDDKFERLGVKFDENDDIWRS